MENNGYIRGAVIVAGGSGRRMGGAMPKQFLPLGAEGKPVIVHTIERFAEALDDGSPIVVAAAADEMARLREIALRFGIWERIRVCEGGDTRFGSVRNGLKEIGRAFGETGTARGDNACGFKETGDRSVATGSGYGETGDGLRQARTFGTMGNVPGENVCTLVAIHDAVRPLAGPGLIARAFEQAREHGSAIPYIRPADSFRMDCGNGTTRICDRERLMAVQTPQVFRYENIRAAYDLPYDPRFTDDAGVYEAAGFTPHMFEGERRNIKITTPSDLALADALIGHGEP